MKAVEIGLKMSMKGEEIDTEHGFIFFGLDEVNAMLALGARITSIEEGGLITHKIRHSDGYLTVALTGFSLKVLLEESLHGTRANLYARQR